MDSFIVGTAGHIDHGKTRLVKALTGVDTDRLIEEKKRGITIELGFAPLRLPNGRRGGMVDVPGHERLIRTMVAGATGIDLALLVVAADEGVMPQTREHLDILALLQVPSLLVALTKADLVDEELLELATQEVSEQLEGTPFAGAPVLPVSSLTGRGISELLAAMVEAVGLLPEREDRGAFRLPVDRSFSLKGFGTVVTGTCTRGRLATGEEVEVLPGGRKAKVRGLQVHGEAVAAAGPSRRVAVNLQGLSVEEAPRGSLLCTPGTLPVSSMVDVRLHLLNSGSVPLKNRARVRVLSGTAEALGVVQFIGEEEGDPPDVEPGHTGMAQIRLDQPLPLGRSDLFVLRRASPLLTLGGGTVLDPQPHRYRPREKVRHRRFLEVLEGRPSPEEAILALLDRELPQALSPGAISLRLGLALSSIRPVLNELESAGKLLCLEGGSAVHARVVEHFSPLILRALTEFHAQEPLLPGIPRSHLRTRMPGRPDPRLFQCVLDTLLSRAVIEADEVSVHLPGQGIRLTPDQEGALRRLELLFRDGGLEPPSPEEVQRSLSPRSDVPSLLAHLLRQGVLLRVKEDILVHREPWATLVLQLRQWFSEHETMDPVAFKDLTGLSRRVAIPMLELLDRSKITVREGNLRRWRGEGA